MDKWIVLRLQIIWLVVWNMTFIFPYIWSVIIPIDELLFFRGVGSTTNQQYECDSPNAYLPSHKEYGNWTCNLIAREEIWREDGRFYDKKKYGHEIGMGKGHFLNHEITLRQIKHGNGRFTIDGGFIRKTTDKWSPNQTWQWKIHYS